MFGGKGRARGKQCSGVGSKKRKHYGRHHKQMLRSSLNDHDQTGYTEGNAALYVLSLGMNHDCSYCQTVAIEQQCLVLYRYCRGMSLYGRIG